ncbi:N-carbamoyl-L-amino-acid hydrolase [Roseibium hamelinense]|uniref:N-carbamoyl-L-amino-acid hydrolase n=1 Tax=Roseibium hamelinense TaxID=150831 RepID=A0A562SUD2_9HYPH|nr:Zn-dependent hydrolase [Roseibium hamelinense]MTI43178.1 Zn-dependent hydrolase [Roseibium hamelinense]TWI84773.1 N-carbamoyl-L-amino-acid hydrolase [Roseibium hamelinense]
MSLAPAKIDLDRLRALLAGVNAFGANPVTGGFNRPGFSDAHMACISWFEDQMRADGLATRRDGAANLFGRLGDPDGPAILIGSHLDTVIEGGAFDGALGACVALECVRAIKEAGLTLKVPIEVAATSEEEGRFGGMLGSQTITGQVSPGWLETAADAGGFLLTDAMTAQGLDPQAIFTSARPPGSVKAFLELHIEQGPVLEAEGIAIGVADRVSGVCSLECVLFGAANHSGTTPMDMRADAFAGLAEVSAAIPDLVRDHGTDQSRITIGRVDLTPNHPHTIPGMAAFTVILRDVDEAVMRALKRELSKVIRRKADKNGLTHRIFERSWLPPAALDVPLADHALRIAGALGVPAKRMPSGAGHDAQTMQALCPSLLVFVPSRNGISHAPEEHSNWADIEKGANLMLQLLTDLTT